MAEDKEKTIEVEAEEVNDFQEFKERIRNRFMKRKQSKWRVIKGKIIAITPIVSLAAYLLMGFLGNLWHPGWIIFLATPLVAMFLSLFDGGRKEKIIGFISALISIAYVAIGFTLKIWHPTWVAFFLIPISAIIIGEDKE